MNPEPERDVLGENLGRALGACREGLARSRVDFLRRASESPGRGGSRRPPSGVLAVAASALLCASIFVAILGSRPRGPVGVAGAPRVAQDPKAPVAPKPGSAREVSLADQIAYQERLLEKATDEKERAVILATLKTLQGDLARTQKSKAGGKASPESTEDRAKQLEKDLEGVRSKLKNAKTPEDQARLRSKENELAQQLQLLDAESAMRMAEQLAAQQRSIAERQKEIGRLQERIQKLQLKALDLNRSQEDRAEAMEEAMTLQQRLVELERRLVEPQGSSPAQKK